MLCIPLNSHIKLKGCLRIILKEGTVYVHHTIGQKKFKSCGDLIVGIDKGYTEAFADSEGNFHGRNFGEVLTEGTEKRNSKGKARNKLHQIAKRKYKNKPIFIAISFQNCINFFFSFFTDFLHRDLSPNHQRCRRS